MAETLVVAKVDDAGILVDAILSGVVVNAPGVPPVIEAVVVGVGIVDV